MGGTHRPSHMVRLTRENPDASVLLRPSQQPEPDPPARGFLGGGRGNSRTGDRFRRSRVRVAQHPPAGASLLGCSRVGIRVRGSAASAAHHSPTPSPWPGRGFRARFRVHEVAGQPIGLVAFARSGTRAAARAARPPLAPVRSHDRSPGAPRGRGTSRCSASVPRVGVIGRPNVHQAHGSGQRSPRRPSATVRARLRTARALPFSCLPGDSA